MSTNVSSDFLSIEEQINVMELVRGIFKDKSKFADSHLNVEIFSIVRNAINSMYPHLMGIEVSKIIPLFIRHQAINHMNAIKKPGCQYSKVWWEFTPEGLENRRRFIEWVLYKLSNYREDKRTNRAKYK